MTSYESDVHQRAADFLCQVQSGQRARKALETERSESIDVDVPEELILVCADRVVTDYVVKMLLPEHGIEVTTLQGTDARESELVMDPKRTPNRAGNLMRDTESMSSTDVELLRLFDALRPHDYRCCVIKPDGSTMDSPKFTTQAGPQRWAAANSNPETGTLRQIWRLCRSKNVSDM